MKYKFIAIASLILFGKTYSQDYKPVLTNNVVHFFDSSSLKLLPYRIDSTLVTDSSVIYRSFSMIRPCENSDYWLNLFNLKGGSWIGNKVEEFPDGRWLFYNSKNQASTINTMENPGVSWGFYQYSNGARIEAEITKVEWLSFLSLSDSVKTIGFTYYDSTGNLSEHFINHKTIQLSKNYGFVSMFDFYRFPTTEIDYLYYTGPGPFSLAGLTQPESGYQNITFSDVFNFSPGDEIHESYSYNAMQNGYENSQTIHLVLESQKDGPNVSYTFERCYNHEWKWSCDSAVQIERKKDTINIVYQYFYYRFLDFLAFEPVKMDNYYFFNESFLEMKAKSGTIFYSQSLGDTVELFIYDGFAPNEYYPGLGGPYGYGGGFESDSWSKIVYSKKNGIGNGNPYYCPTLLPIDEAFKNKITIAPNPANEVLKLNGYNGNGNIEILNLQGQKVMSISKIGRASCRERV